MGRRSPFSQLRNSISHVTIAKLCDPANGYDLSTPAQQEAAFYRLFDELTFPDDLTEEQWERLADTIWRAVQHTAHRAPSGAN
ncbi:hypothetical protein [Streptomyces sp. NPDC001978]|uniref:hypothetical protein n=1 Tax=Streptomyces sp. NPDC001978 TaxID=3364627 RepID=UPI00368D21A1